jgi:integron integrase
MEEASPPGPRLLDQVRRAIRAKHYSRRTEEAYVYWIRKYILFHKKRHPKDLDASAVTAFLGWLAVEESVSASTQNQALSALVFLYKDVLHLNLGAIDHVPRAKESVHAPVVMSVDEVRRVLGHLAGVSWLVASLLYGAGLRLQECLELRVKDLDFDRHEITVRRGKGRKDRRVMLPASVRERLRQHLESVRVTHDRDVVAGFGRVVLPDALERKFPHAPTEWRWQFVFPAARVCRDPRFGPPSRYHLHESAVQRAVAGAARAAGVAKRVTCHTFRHHADSRIMPRVCRRTLSARGRMPRCLL